jgi:hypothetical protein
VEEAVGLRSLAEIRTTAEAAAGIMEAVIRLPNGVAVVRLPNAMGIQERIPIPEDVTIEVFKGVHLLALLTKTSAPVAVELTSVEVKAKEAVVSEDLQEPAAAGAAAPTSGASRTPVASA